MIGRARPRPDRTGGLRRTTIVRAAGLVTALLLLSGAPALAQEGSGPARLEEPVRFTARDSLVVVLRDSAESARLYGGSGVTYRDSRLRAWTIDLRFDRDEVRALGIANDTTGRPTIVQGGETFTGTELSFNLRTERGRVVAARTAIEDGFIRADVVKAAADSTLYIRNGVYTTCPCVDDPSYSLRAETMKIVGRKWIYTGPIQLFLYNIPTPLWLPFGFLPATEGRRSGPLAPTYGEDEFGFYLRDFGWYFALSDYVDLQLQGGVWTRGSLEARALSRYRKRYGVSGQVQLGYGRFRTGERTDPDFSVRTTGSLRWNHAQPLSPSASFDADVNLSGSGYLRAVSQNYDDRTRQTLQSSIRYSKRWTSSSLTVNASQRQVVETGAASLTLPTVSFTRNSFKPFQRRDRAPGSRESLVEKVTLGYSFTADNRFDFTRLSDDALLAAGDTAATTLSWIDALLSQDDYERATGNDERFAVRASHRVPVSAPLSIERLPLVGAFRVNVSPSLSYTEDWFVRSERQALVGTDGAGGLESRSVPGFTALRQFSASIAASTVFYGLFPLRVGPYRSLRHTVRPNLGFSWRPDFFDERWGYTRTYRDAGGKDVVYPIVQGVGRGLQQAVTFALANTFETKRATASDTTATAGPTATPQVVKLLDFSLATSYNFAADSMGFGSINVNGRTRLFGRLDVDFRSTHSAYRVSDSGRTVDRLAFSPSSPLGRLTSASLTVRTALRSSSGGGTASRPFETPNAGFTSDRLSAMDAMETTLRQPFGGDPVDFSVPWSLTLDLTYGITRPGVTTVRRAIVNAGFDFSLTPRWKVSGRTGYDFELREPSMTNITVARDFDCWQMALNWIPFGAYQSYGFDLHVKSGKLRDLLRIRQPKSDVRDRFGSMLR